MSKELSGPRGKEAIKMYPKNIRELRTRISTQTGGMTSADEKALCDLVGESVIRLRMGGEDAHYAGGLVDGSRMLKLFGDVATELLIRLDGDEGLFRAYESIEFLAPVRSGDYIEARGRIVAIGKSSRKMEFKAIKVIQSLEGHQNVAVSAAELLEEPILVCQAKGTCVTPVDFQRFTAAAPTQKA
jgi:acyl-CoA hydrolase